MPIDKDTDPSTPRALRSNDALADAETPPEGTPSRPTTDPGLGSPPSSRPTGARPPPITVPPPSVRPAPGAAAVLPFEPVPPRKDSVELLLEGMTEPRLDRTRTTPQSDGEAAAAYHAEHRVRPARPPSGPSDDAKVLVDRATGGAAADRRARQLAAEAPTYVSPRRPARQVAAAAAFGAVVACATFFGVQRSSRPRATRAALAAPAALATAVAPAMPTAPPAPAAVAPDAAVQGTASASAPAAAAATPKRKARPSPRATSTTGTDALGEFKTTF